MDLADWQGDCGSQPTVPPMFPAADTVFAGPRFRDTRQAQLATLALAIESQVLPRLLDARRCAAELNSAQKADNQNTRRTAPAWQPDAGVIEHFVGLALDRDETLALAHFQDLADRGIPLEVLYDRLLAPAARRLGRMWDEDEVSFTAVTTGTWRIQRILHAMSPAFVAIAPAPRPGGRILLLPAIGSQHSLGMAMVAEFFRRAGWDVSTERAQTDGDLQGLVRGAWFDVIGFSVGSDDLLDVLVRSIAAARLASRNLRLGVMVGGPVFVADPALAARVGADATASDAAQATLAAEGLMATLAATG